MRHECRVQAGLQRRIDFRLGIVAHHPAVRFHHVMPVDQALVGGDAFLRDDFDGVEKSLETGALDLRGLLGGLDRKSVV